VAPDLSALPEPAALVPVAVNWTQGGSVVEVEGSFDNWQSRQALHRSGNREFAIVKMLPPGVYQYKFIVDGEWKYAPDQPAMYDEMGNVNNVLEVQEYVPEILDSLDSFLAPSSPPESYNNALFSPEDFAKEPPACPPHLHLTLLNVPQIPDAPNLLPRPMHTVLNHIYNSGPSGMGVQVMGTTHRYRRYVRLSRRNPTRSSRRVTAFARTFHRVWNPRIRARTREAPRSRVSRARDRHRKTRRLPPSLRRTAVFASRRRHR
jgi:5'-AMP-activated protein kinase regulatory beta subunit